MEVLKNIGYCIMAVLGLCLALGVGVVVTFLGGMIGTIALGAAIVGIVVIAIREAFTK
jgi:hypothetical protein